MSTSVIRVLVVDDDPGVRQSLQLLLSDEEHAVTCVASGPEALELTTRETFDVIVTDYRMPDMTGAELAAELKARFDPPPYCILLSGTPNEVKPSMPGATELVMVLGKPFDPARLIRVVTQVGRLGVNRRRVA
jgi:CheY-like chemotaxis protein